MKQHKQSSWKGVARKFAGCVAAAGLAASMSAGAAFATDLVQTAYDLPSPSEVKSFDHQGTDAKGNTYTYQYVTIGSSATGRTAPMMETYYETVGLNYINAYCGPGTIFKAGSDPTAWYERSDSNLYAPYTEGTIGSLKTHNSTLAIQLNNENPDEYVWNYLCWANGADVSQDSMAVDHGNNGQNNVANSALQPVSVTVNGTEYADFPRDVYTECNILSVADASATYGDTAYEQWIALENARENRPKSGTYEPYYAKYSAVSGGGATMVAGLHTLANTVDSVVAQSADANGNFQLQSRFGGNSANGTGAAINQYEDLVQATQYYVLANIADGTVSKATTAVLVGYDPQTDLYACRKYLVDKTDARGNQDKDVNLYGGRLAAYLGDYSTSITDLGLPEKQQPASSVEADYIAWYSADQIVENCDAVFVCDAPSSNKVSDYLATASDGQTYVVYSPATARSDGEEDRTASLTKARATALAQGKKAANFCFSYPATMFGNFYAQGVENGMIPLVTASFTYPKIFGDNGLTDMFAYWAKYVWHIKDANLQGVVTATAGDMSLIGDLKIGTISSDFEKNARVIFCEGNDYYLNNMDAVDAINNGNMKTFDVQALTARVADEKAELSDELAARAAAKAAAKLKAQTITAKNYTKTFGAKAFSLGAKTNGDGKLTYASSNKKVATVSSAGKVTIKGAGTAKITIKAAATSAYKAASKTVTVKVNKAKNPVTIAKKTINAKASQLKKAKKTYSISKARKAQGKVTYSIASAKKGTKSFKSKFSINKSTGKLTVKKGTAKGTYKVTVKATAKGNANYKAGSKTAVVTVKVK